MKPTSAPQTYRVKSFGCQMNVYDGERMGELLAAQGIVPAPEGEDADLVVLNTCHIREKATEKVYSDIGRLRREDGSSPLIAVAGCVAQAEGAEIMARAPAVSMVVGPQAYQNLPAMLERAVSGQRTTEMDLAAEAKFAGLPQRRTAPPAAFLTIQEGCDKFCTYCVVPYTRGAEISRPFAELVAEAQRLVEGGARELTLLGQNVSAWSGEDAKGHRTGLAGLVRELAKIDGLARIRYTTSHPADMDEEIIAAHGEVDKLMPFLHLPVQAGSDRILAAMNRSHSVDSYLRVIERVRAARPDIAISGDFIVGFPGETDADFEATLDIVRATNYAMAYSFKYSRRPGTPAATMEGQVAEAVMNDRLQRLQALLNAQQQAFNEATVGRTTRLLLERKGKHAGQLIGKSPWLQSVHVTAPGLAIGDMVDVRVTSAGPNSLGAEPLLEAVA